MHRLEYGSGLAVALLIACTGSDGAPDVDSAPCLTLPTGRAPDGLTESPTSSCTETLSGAEALAAFDAFVTSLDVRYCEQSVRCGVHPDVEACRIAVPAAGLFVDQIRRGVELGRTRVMPGALAPLVDWITPRSGCEQGHSAQVFESALSLAFPGSAAQGEPCWLSTDCAGPSRCDYSRCSSGDACCSGMCTPFRRGALVGESCEIDECGVGLSCWRLDSEPVLTCHAALRDGETCTGAFGESCEEGTTCMIDAAGARHCSVWPPLDGETCQEGTGGTLGCGQLDVACKDYRLCAPRPGVGEACDFGHECVQQANCIDGVCQLRIPLGGACEPFGADCMVGLRCNDQSGVCETYPERVPCPDDLDTP